MSLRQTALHLAALAALMAALVAPAARPVGRGVSQGGDRVQALVTELAAHQPEAIIGVIVQKAAPQAAVAALIEQLGGQVTRDLSLINAVAARLPAAQAVRLAQAPEVHSVVLDAPVHDADAGPLTGLLREDFTLGVHTETAAGVWSSGWDWSGAPWAEVGESDGPVAGDVAVTSFLAGDLQGLRLQGAGRGLLGSADLSDADAAQLSLAYRRYGLSGAADFVRVEVSADGGQTWAELGQLAGPGSDLAPVTAVYDLTGFTAAAFVLRLTTSDGFSPEGRVYVDWLQVDYAPRQQPAAERPEALFNTLWLPTIQSQRLGATAEATAAQAAAYTVRDDFSLARYSNNTGTHKWKTNWIEADAAGAAAQAGNIDIYFGELWLDDNPDTGTQPSLRRTADLSGAVEANLSFSFRTTSGVDAADAVAVEISPNGGQDYYTLEVIGGLTGARRETRTYPITAYAAKDTVVRFRVQQDYDGWAESIALQ